MLNMRPIRLVHEFVDHAAEGPVQVELAGDDVGENRAAVFDNGGGSFVAG